MGRLSTSTTFEAAGVAQADVVVEAAFERMEVQQRLV